MTKEVIESVFSHIDQVIATIFLSVILLYWFSIISFNAHWKGEYGFDD